MAEGKSVITCAKCQGANPLGRVFCATCGARLDLLGMTRDVVSSRVGAPTAGRLVVKVIGIVILVVVALAVVACIPQTAPIGVEGSRSGLSAILGFARTGEHLPQGRTLGRRFTEAEINGFFMGEKARQMKVESFSVDIRDGAVHARMVRVLGRFNVGSWQVQPVVSCEAAFTPNGKRLRFRSAKHGLLPLVGPMKYAVGQLMLGHLSSLPEFAVAKYVSDIKTGDDVVEVTLQH